MPTGQGCSVDEYIKGDDNLPVCTDLDSDTWDANFLSQLGQQEKESEDEDDWFWSNKHLHSKCCMKNFA